MAPILGIYASQISGHLFAPSGAYDSIATVTSSGSSNSLTFSSIPQTYTHLQIRAITRDTGGSYGYNVNMRFNSDSGSNYTYHGLEGNGSSASAFGSSSATTQFPFATSSGGANASGTFAPIVCDILDYSNTSKYKVHRTLNGYDDNGSGYIEFRSGVWLNTTAVTSITVLSTGSNFANNTQFALYGIKGN
jgi:hypothetical protein